MIKNGFEIYIKNTPYSVDAMYKRNGIATSFLNYGIAYSLKLYECKNHIFIAKKGCGKTTIFPVIINERKGYVTTGAIPQGCDFVTELKDEEIKKVIHNIVEYKK